MNRLGQADRPLGDELAPAVEEEALDPTPYSDLELLSAALQDALDAKARGVLIGPEVDEVSLRRAERRARRADARRLLNTQFFGGAA